MIEEFQLTLENGDPIPEPSSGSAEVGLTFCLTFFPNTELETLGDREVHPPTQWRVMAQLSDENGDRVYLPDSTGEFFSYEYMGSFRKDPLTPNEHVLWISPDPPEEMKEGTEYRWSRVALPEEAGTYHLAVVVYPTADPDVLGIQEVWGEGETIYEGTVEVAAGKSAMNLGYQGSVGLVTELEREILTPQLRSRMTP